MTPFETPLLAQLIDALWLGIRAAAPWPAGRRT